MGRNRRDGTRIGRLEPGEAMMHAMGSSAVEWLSVGDIALEVMLGRSGFMTHAEAEL